MSSTLPAHDAALAPGLAPPPAAPASCRNCDAPMHGPFCAQCGQHAVHEDPTFRELAHDAGQELLQVDGKIVGTLRLLFRHPGALTVEHWHGRRARYVPPLRLYLTLSVLYFLVAALTNPIEKAIARGDSPVRTTVTSSAPGEAPKVNDDSVAAILEAEGRKKGGLAGRFMVRSAQVQRDKAGFGRSMRAALPKIFFAFVPVFAGVVALVYRRRRHYPAHLYFALHVFAFCFAVATLGRVLSLVPGVDGVVGWLVFLAFVGYPLLAMRRVYGGSWKETIARGALVGALSLVAFSLIGLVGVSLVFFTF